jgi:hypothetical protein
VIMAHMMMWASMHFFASNAHTYTLTHTHTHTTTQGLRMVDSHEGFVPGIIPASEDEIRDATDQVSLSCSLFSPLSIFLSLARSLSRSLCMCAGVCLRLRLRLCLFL